LLIGPLVVTFSYFAVAVHGRLGSNLPGLPLGLLRIHGNHWWVIYWYTCVLGREMHCLLLQWLNPLWESDLGSLGPGQHTIAALHLPNLEDSQHSPLW
uniref:Uncharacterized protein n=1 Tax=Romanomermis culicivorax TaxID=13658 RepID=A0A915JBG9_ROMCU